MYLADEHQQRPSTISGLVDWTGGLIAKRSGSHSVVSRSPARVCDIDTHSDPAQVGGANSPRYVGVH